MEPTSTACETCGLDTSVDGRCRKHPGAGQLDLRDPDDVAWAVSLQELAKERRRRALKMAAIVGFSALLSPVMLRGLGETIPDHLDRLSGHDNTAEAFIMVAAVATAVAAVLGRIGRDAYRAVTGRDTTPEAFTLRRARGVRAVLVAVGGLLLMAGLDGAYLLATGTLATLGWALAPLGFVGLALLVAGKRMRMPETPDVAIPLPVVDAAQSQADAAGASRGRAARQNIRARHRPPVHIKTAGGT